MRNAQHRIQQSQDATWEEIDAEVKSAVEDVHASRGALAATSPRLRGEVGWHRR
jgi:hypothetical protein